MNTVVCFLLGYFVGTINPSYFLGRIKGVDIRKKGSGNAGGSNALILFGKTAGVLCSLFDIFKAFLMIRLTEHLFPDFPLAFPLTACAVILGHIFPFYMKFRGGKGLACLGGGHPRIRLASIPHSVGGRDRCCLSYGLYLLCSDDSFTDFSHRIRDPDARCVGSAHSFNRGGFHLVQAYRQLQENPKRRRNEVQLSLAPEGRNGQDRR